LESITTRKHKVLPLPIEGWQWIVTLWYVNWFKVIEWCQGSVDPTKAWWHGLIPKEFIQQRPPLDSKGILSSLHEWLTSIVPYYYNCLWAFPMSSWSNEFSSQMCKCETSRIFSLSFFYIYFFNNHKRVWVLFQNPNLKVKLVIPWSTWALLDL